MPPGRRNFSLKSVRIPAKKLLASGPKSLAAGHIANFQTSPSSTHLLQTRISGDTSLPTLGWGKQSTWLAASGSRRICGRVARTHSGRGDKQPQEGPCRDRFGPVCWFNGGSKGIPGKFRRHQTAYGAETVPNREIKQGFPCVRPRDILNLPNHSDSPWAIEAADTRRRISCGYHNGHALEHPEPEIPRTGDSDIGSVFSTPARRLSRLADVGEIDFCTPEKSTPEKGVKGDCSGGAGCEGTAPVVNRFT